MSDIVERLRKVESSTQNMSNSVTTNWYRNPDGPEAADEIERLRARYDALVDELREIVAENERLQSRLAEAERLINELEGHEGAESWSDYLRKDLAAFHVNWIKAEDY